MAAAATNQGQMGRGAGRAGNPARRQFLFAAYAGIVLLGVLFGVPAAVVDVLLICTGCFAAGLVLIVLMARKMEEVTSFPRLVMAATCLHLVTTVAAARRVILSEGQVGMIAGSVGARLVELSAVLCAIVFLCIAGVSVAVMVTAVRHLRTRAVLNIAVLAGGPQAGGKDAAARLAFNTGMGWAARYIILDAVTAVLLLCIAVGGAGVIGTMEQVNYVAAAVGAGIVSLAPAVAVALAAAGLMAKGFVACKTEEQASRASGKPAEAAVVAEPAQTAKTGAKEAVFDEPSSVRAEREYQRIADMLLEGRGKEAKVILMAARNSAEMGVTLPVNVAAKIAERKRRCLIVDMDVSRDAVAKAFDLSGMDGPTKTCIRGLYVWGAKSFCDASVPTAKKLEAAKKHFEKIIIYWPGAGQGYEDIAQNVGAAMFYGRKGAEMAVLEARLAKRGCIMLANELL
jgi:hypothetical protein